jgi:hypothetical protein
VHNGSLCLSVALLFFVTITDHTFCLQTLAALVHTSTAKRVRSTQRAAQLREALRYGLQFMAHSVRWLHYFFFSPGTILHHIYSTVVLSSSRFRPLPIHPRLSACAARIAQRNCARRYDIFLAIYGPLPLVTIQHHIHSTVALSVFITLATLDPTSKAKRVRSTQRAAQLRAALRYFLQFTTHSLL